MGSLDRLGAQEPPRALRDRPGHDQGALRAPGRLSCSLDLFPTFCDWAQVSEKQRPPLEGKSFAGACVPGGDSSGWNEVAVSISTIDTIITKDGWRLTQYGPGQGQLFDLRNDPGEQRNLHGHPEHLGKKVGLLERLVQLRARPRALGQYRNMSLASGRRIDTGRAMEAFPLYTAPACPWLTDGERPEWYPRESA